MLLNTLRALLTQLFITSVMFFAQPHLGADQSIGVDPVCINAYHLTEEQVLQELAQIPSTTTRIWISASYGEAEITLETLYYICDHYPNLKHLSLPSLEMNNEALKQATLSFPCLEYLQIGVLRKESLEESGATAFAVACPNLQWFDIDYGVTDAAVESILKLCPDMVYLTLANTCYPVSKFPPLTDCCLKAIASYGKNLKKVSIYNASAFTHEGIKSFLATCNSELEFSLSNDAVQIIPEEIFELAKCRYFNFHYSRQLNYMDTYILLISSSPTQEPDMKIIHYRDDK